MTTSTAPTTVSPVRADVRVLRIGTLSLVIHPRSAVVTTALVAMAVLVAGGALLLGSYDLQEAGVLGILGGAGSPLDRFIVLDQRLPRALAALTVGALLGSSGAIFQSLSRNPLGSPDIVGFTTGATSGGLVALLVTGAPTAASVVGGALIGGMLTAVFVIVLAARRGLGGEPLILAGIAVGAMLASINDYLISRAPIESAEAARTWQFGSLGGIAWAQTTPLLITGIALLLIVPGASRSLQLLALGDDAARALGLRHNRARVALLALGVALCAVAVAAAGPIGFLALAAPQLARRLCRGAGVALMPSAATGALLLAVADLLAQRLLAPFQIPVGLVSGAVGGLYLMWLLGLGRIRD